MLLGKRTGARTRFGALTLRYPASWHALNPTSTDVGPVTYLGYIVSTRGIVRCTREPKPLAATPSRG